MMFSRAVKNSVQATQKRAMSIMKGQMTYQTMKESKVDFVKFVNAATLDRKSPEAKEMYKYLNKCFVDNDTDYDGLVSLRGFNAMVAEAAVAPRRFGFAPHTREMYSSADEYEKARLELFNSMKNESGRVPQENWIKWAMAHIDEKVGKGLEEHELPRWERSQEECIAFFQGVTKEGSSHNKKSSSSTQFKEFYMYLNDMFVMADTSGAGLLNETDYKKLMTKTSWMSKRFGMDWFSGCTFADAATQGKVTWKGYFDQCLGVVSKNAPKH